MHDDIRRVMAQITALEAELRERVHEHEAQLAYRIEGRRIEFAADVRATHRQLRTNLLRWLAQSSWRNVVSAPLVYALIVPFGLLDLSMTAYQALCFRLYRIPRAARADYIVIDRHRLEYLNALQKLNCVYCGYVNGLIAYTREIGSRTEQYWCPIKHARRVLGTHPRYAQFLEYGEAEELPLKVHDLREQLRNRDDASRARG
jgi:hypothetical protein